jgi:hypothetical protein
MEVSARIKRMVLTAGGVLVALQESPTEEFGGHPEARRKVRPRRRRKPGRWRMEEGTKMARLKRRNSASSQELGWRCVGIPSAPAAGVISNGI